MNIICRLITALVLAAALYLALDLLPKDEKEQFEEFRGGHWGWSNPGNRSWWYWGLPRWSRVPTVAYPCNPFWGNCPNYLYNPYSYIYSYKNSLN